MFRSIRTRCNYFWILPQTKKTFNSSLFTHYTSRTYCAVLLLYTWCFLSQYRYYQYPWYIYQAGRDFEKLGHYTTTTCTHSWYRYRYIYMYIHSDWGMGVLTGVNHLNVYGRLPLSWVIRKCVFFTWNRSFYPSTSSTPSARPDFSAYRNTSSVVTKPRHRETTLYCSKQSRQLNDLPSYWIR